MEIGDDLDRVGVRGGDQVVNAVVGHVDTKVREELFEVVREPGIGGEDEGWSGLEKAFQVEMLLLLGFCRVLSSCGRHLW